MKRCHPMAPQYIYIHFQFIFKNYQQQSGVTFAIFMPSSKFWKRFAHVKNSKVLHPKNHHLLPATPQKKRISFLTPRLDDIDSTITWQQTTWLRNFGHFGKIEGKRLWGFACWNFQTWFGFSMDFWQLHRKGAAFLLHLFFLIPVMSAVS